MAILEPKRIRSLSLTLHPNLLASEKGGAEEGEERVAISEPMRIRSLCLTLHPNLLASEKVGALQKPSLSPWGEGRVRGDLGADEPNRSVPPAALLASALL